jgi:predicted nucleic acid-binding protein
MIFVDTGYLIALADHADELHDRAMAWSLLISEPIALTDYIIVETLNALSDPADRPYWHRLVDSIRQSPDYDIVHVDYDLHLRACELHHARTDKHWSLTDCVSFVVMQERKIWRALAYDHHFDQAGFEALLRRDP